MSTALQKEVAEQATGMSESPSGLGTFYANGGAALTRKSAIEHLRKGGAIEAPNAGAGSYREAFQRLGFSEVSVFQDGSSAGDWSFMVRDAETGFWHPAWQNNRYPRHGYTYTVDFTTACCTQDKLASWMDS